MVVVDHDARGLRQRLAGERVAGGDLPGLERVVLDHLDLALDDLRPTGAAHAAPAGIGQVEPGAQRRVDYRLALRDREGMPHAVEDDLGDRLWGLVDDDWPRHGSPGAALGRGEALEMDLLVAKAERLQRRLGILKHAAWAADEDVVDFACRHDGAQQQRDLPGVETPVEDRDVLRLARQDVEYRQALDEAVLQVLERFAEDDARAGAVAIEQEEAAPRLARQRRFHDRQNRRDAGAAGKTDIGAHRLGLRRDAEAAHRRHYLERLARPDRLAEKPGEAPAGDLLHRHPELAVVEPGADRIGAPQLLALVLDLQRQVLAGREAIGLSERVRHREGDRHRVRSLRTDLRDRERVEVRGHRIRCT